MSIRAWPAREDTGTIARQWLAPLAWLLTCAWLIHGSALQGHWRIDDPLVLLHVLKQPSAWADFMVPAAWRQLEVPFFTPLLVLDYRIDHAIFGLEPAGHYARHLLMLTLCALLSYQLLRPATGSGIALLGASLFLAGAPTVVVAQQLMARHYATGLALALLASLVWLRSQRRAAAGWIGALLYLLALCSKEVFLPLPLVLLCSPVGSLRERLSRLWPLCITALAFLVWRATMLGHAVGGYTGELLPLSTLADSTATWPRVIFGSGWPMGLGLLLLAAGLVRWGADQPVAKFLFAAACVLALSLPSLGVRGSTDITLYRFSFLPWWAVSMALGLGAAAWLRPPTPELPTRPSWRRVIAVLTLVGVAAPVAATSQQAHRSVIERHQPYDIQGRFIWTHDEGTSLVPGAEPASVIQFQYATAALKRMARGEGSPALIPRAHLQPLLGTGPDVHVFDPACQCVRRDAGTDTHSGADLPPTSVAMWRPPVGLGWRIEAPGNAAMHCHLFSDTLNVSALIPCAGVLRYGPPAWLSGSFRVILISSDDGRWGLTPPLRFPSRAESVCWPSTTSCPPTHPIAP